MTTVQKLLGVIFMLLIAGCSSLSTDTQGAVNRAMEEHILVVPLYHKNF